MGSFLANSPVGYDGGPLDRCRTRSILIDGALDAIDADPSNGGAWLQLGGFAAGGLDQPAYQRLVSAVSAEPARLAKLVAAGVEPPLWRSVLQPIAARDVPLASHYAKEVVHACRWLGEHRSSRGGASISPDVAVEELIELAAVIAGCAGKDGPSVFADLLEGFTQRWPALRDSLHQTVGNLTARTPSGRADELWTLLNRLAAR